MERTLAQIKQHYDVERELADRLRQALPHERKDLYGSLYNELFRRVPDHPQIFKKERPESKEASLTRQVKLLSRFLDPASTFLEIGAGDCSLTRKVASLSAKCYALDVSSAILSNVRLEPNMEVLLSDGCSIPLEKNSVTVAYSYQVLEHMHEEDAARHLVNMLEVLQPGGVYMCVTPNRLNGPHDVSVYFDAKATGFHMKEYTVTELCRVMLRAGFREAVPYVGFSNRYCRVPRFLLSMLERLLGSLPARASRFFGGLPVIRNLLFISVAARK